MTLIITTALVQYITLASEILGHVINLHQMKIKLKERKKEEEKKRKETKESQTQTNNFKLQFNIILVKCLQNKFTRAAPFSAVVALCHFSLYCNK